MLLRLDGRFILRIGCGFQRRRPPIPIASRPPFQSDGGHHSNRIAARLASSRRSVLVLSQGGSLGQASVRCLRQYRLKASADDIPLSSFSRVRSRVAAQCRQVQLNRDRRSLRAPPLSGCRSDCRGAPPATWHTRPVVHATRQLRHASAGCRATIKVRTPDNQDEKDVPPLAAQGGRSPTGGASGGKFA